MLEGARVAAVVPCHNEAAFVARSVMTMPDCVDHVLVMDDASDDGTADIAAALIPRAGTSVEVHRLWPNRGVGGAIVAGYQRALTLGVQAVVVTNGDGQMHGEDARTLLQPVVTNRADLVKGNRLWCPGTRRNIPLVRRLGIHALGLATAGAAGVHVSDAQSGYHAIRADALPRLDLTNLWPRYGFPNDLLVRAAAAGLRIEERPVRAIYGNEVSGLTGSAAMRVLGVVLRAGLARHRRRCP